LLKNEEEINLLISLKNDNGISPTSSNSSTDDSAATTEAAVDDTAATDDKSTLSVNI